MIFCDENGDYVQVAIPAIILMETLLYLTIKMALMYHTRKVVVGNGDYIQVTIPGLLLMVQFYICRLKCRLCTGYHTRKLIQENGDYVQVTIPV